LAALTDLDRPVTLHFPDETPLENVLKAVKQATTGPDGVGLPIYVDPKGLEKLQKTLSSPVVIDVEAVPLKTALRWVLKQLGLKYTVAADRGMLMIVAE
jgi:hypothetical protein